MKRRLRGHTKPNKEAIERAHNTSEGAHNNKEVSERAHSTSERAVRGQTRGKGEGTQYPSHSWSTGGGPIDPTRLSSTFLIEGI